MRPNYTCGHGIIILIGQETIGFWLGRIRSLFIRACPEEFRDQLIFLGAEYDDGTVEVK